MAHQATSHPAPSRPNLRTPYVTLRAKTQAAKPKVVSKRACRAAATRKAVKDES